MAVALETVIKNIDKAIETVRTRMRGRKLGITLQKAEIELKVTTVGSVGAGFKWEVLIPIEISTKEETTDVTTITLSLTPSPGTAAMATQPLSSDELASAILRLGEAMSQASINAAGHFSVGEGKVALEFEINDQGKIQAIAGVDAKSGSKNSITLTFEPS